LKNIAIAMAILLVMATYLHATQQIPERVLYQGHNYALMVEGSQTNQLIPSFPLPVSGLLPPGKCMSTACYRGYVGQWQLREDKLFLIKLEDCQRPPNEIPLSMVNKGWESPVFADWVSGKYHLIAERNNARSSPDYLRHHLITLKDGKVCQSTTLADLTETAKGWLDRYMRFKTGDQIDYHYQFKELDMQTLLNVEAVDAQGRFLKGTQTSMRRCTLGHANRVTCGTLGYGR